MMDRGIYSKAVLHFVSQGIIFVSPPECMEGECKIRVEDSRFLTSSYYSLNANECREYEEFDVGGYLVKSWVCRGNDWHYYISFKLAERR